MSANAPGDPKATKAAKSRIAKKVNVPVVANSAPEALPPAVAPKSASPKPSGSRIHRTIELSISVLAIVLLLVVGLWQYHLASAHKASHTPQPSSSSTMSPTPTPSPSSSPTPANEISAQTYNAAVPLTNLNFFKPSSVEAMFGTNCSGISETADCPPTITSSQIHYVQIGLTAENQPVIVAYNYDHPMQTFWYIAIETTPARYEILGLYNDALNPGIPSNKGQINQTEDSLETNVTLNTWDTIAALDLPQNAIVSGLAIHLADDYAGPDGYFIASLTGLRGAYYQSTPSSQIAKLGTIGDTTYYEVTVQSKSAYSVKEIYAVVGGVFAAEYLPTDPLTATNSPSIEFTDGDNLKTYLSGTFGCGSDGYVTLADVSPSSLEYAGFGPGNETIYELPQNSPLFATINGQNLLGNALTPSQINTDHAVIVAKNSLGEYVLYERSDLYSYGGCGKPVIYLYPAHTENVNVAVGANVTNSDPAYPISGWRNVLARPNGDLTYQGQNYPSLYWEGTGYGTYPLITQGSVVPTNKAISTILTQLAAQGINQKEASDFIAYWGPRLPSTPYVRLSWLNTAQMNELAPLSISPQPQTLIRVFLDAKGLSAPISMQPQTFTKPARTGFTVVEWGGLLTR